MEGVPNRRRVLRTSGWLLALAVLGFVAWRAWQWFRPPPRLVPSRETTYLTEPARQDGTIDHAAAWRAAHCTGVTPENNGALLLCAAMGLELDRFSEEERAALPEVVTTFVPWAHWAFDHPDVLGRQPDDPVSDLDDAVEAFERGETNGPAAAAIRQWLAAMKEPLDLARRASERERFFVPFDGPLANHPHLDWRPVYVFLGLRLRAMCATANGDFAAACEELVATIRLVRLVGSFGFAECEMEFLGEAAAWQTARCAARLHGGITAAELAPLAAAAERTPFDARAGLMLEEHRIFFLDGLRALGRPAPGPAPDSSPRRRPSFESLFSRLDPNRLSRRLNEWFDRLDHATLDPAPWDERLRRLVQLRGDARRVGRAAKRGMLSSLLAGPDAVADAAADILASVFVAAVQRQVLELARCMAEADVAFAELAALAYAADSGRDPVSTEELDPVALARPFRDRLTGSPLQCRREAGGDLVVDGPVVDLLHRLEAVQNESETR